jgi:hypothetical protein
VTTWHEGVAAIATGTTPDPGDRRRWMPWIKRVPIVVTGSAGAGKTAIWRHLTGGSAPDAMSTTVDQGYFFSSNSRRRNLAITTIPGQTSEQRYLDLDRYFGSTTAVRGIIFVASFGFDRVWPGESDLTAAELPRLDIDDLSGRNIQRGLRSFQETCGRIRQKFSIAREPDSKPRWLLVLANKADLYWDAIDQAERYYAPGYGSEFDREAQQLLEDLGRMMNFQYEVLPMALTPIPYEFASNRGSFLVESQLGQRHAEASLDLLGNALERLNGL